MSGKKMEEKQGNIFTEIYVIKRCFIPLMFVCVLLYPFTNVPAGPVTLDFETLTDGSSTVLYSSVENSYLDYGVTFGSIMDGDMSYPKFGNYSGHASSTIVQDMNRIGGETFNIVANFTSPVEYIMADVYAPLRYSMSMTAKDALGVVLGEVTSSAFGNSFLKETLSLSNIGSIYSVEWETSDPVRGSPGIDNLTFNHILAPLVYPEFLFPLQSSGQIELTTQAGGLSTDPREFDTPYGWAYPYFDPYHKTDEAYFSLDFNDETGGTVIAADAGTIVNISTDNNYSRITIDHGNSYFTEYAEFFNNTTDLLVSEGQYISAGTPLGTLEAGPDNHLHFQVKYSSDQSYFGTGLSMIEREELHGVKVGGLFIEEYKLGTYVNPIPEPDIIITLPVNNFAELILDSVTVAPVGTGISGEFRPNFGASLEEAATIGGYDHFNWLSIVVRDNFLDSPVVNTFLGNSLRDQNGELPTVPYVDPVYGGYQSQVDEFGRDFPVRDNLDWYWDEQFSSNGQVASSLPVVLSQLDGALVPLLSPNKLLFSDFPNTPLGYDLLFETYLVGVYEDDTGDVLDFGTPFSWEYLGNPFFNFLDEVVMRGNSDQGLVSGGTSQFLGFISPGEIPPDRLNLFESQGIGVRGSSAEPIPEPATIALLGIGLAGLAGGAVRRRLKKTKQ